MPQLRIDQFAPTVAAGDGVTNSLLFIRSLLRALGYRSDIHSFSIPAALRSEIQDARHFYATDSTLLLYHHSMGHDHGDWLLGLPCDKALIYHNITPAEFFPGNSVLRRYAELGRQQLSEWRTHFRAAIAVSTLNACELNSAGYTDTTLLPLLVDTTRLGGEQQRPSFVRDLPAGVPIYLSVGRLAENKRQYLLIEAFHHLMGQRRQDGLGDARLILIGGTTSEEYASGLRRHVYGLNLIGKVLLPGKCNDAELRWLYHNAHQYWCASAHEGFCMPLIEAGHAGVPIIACARSNIPDTMGEAGLLLDSDDPLELAMTSHVLDTDSQLRQQVSTAGTRNLQRYQRPHLQQRLAAWLAHILPSTPEGKPAPCNASY